MKVITESSSSKLIYVSKTALSLPYRLSLKSINDGTPSSSSFIFTPSPLSSQLELHTIPQASARCILLHSWNSAKSKLGASREQFNNGHFRWWSATVSVGNTKVASLMLSPCTPHHTKPTNGCLEVSFIPLSTCRPMRLSLRLILSNRMFRVYISWKHLGCKICQHVVRF